MRAMSSTSCPCRTGWRKSTCSERAVDGAARVARCNDEGGLVHPRERLAAEQGAEVIRVIGKHDLDQARFDAARGVRVRHCPTPLRTPRRT